MGIRPRALEGLVARMSFWRNKRVLVTGHTGFKGSWLSLYLLSRGAQVRGLALAPDTTPSLFGQAGLDRDLPDAPVDLRDAAATEARVRDARPEIVFHLAAQPLVRRSYREPVETLAVNVLGTAHILEAVRRVGGVRAVVVVTTDKCYENREWRWAYREVDRLGGHDPYSASKACAELVTAAYRKSFFSDAAGPVVASARAGNVIGGGDWAEDRLLPDLMRARAAGRPGLIRNPGSIRPWQHVLDCLAGYLRLARYAWERGPEADSAWNFAPDPADAQPVAWLADLVDQLWPGPAWTRSAGELAAPHEATYLRLDHSKARQLLGWRPGWALPEALARTVAWYRAVAGGADARPVTMEQINEYFRQTGGEDV